MSNYYYYFECLNFNVSLHTTPCSSLVHSYFQLVQTPDQRCI